MSKLIQKLIRTSKGSGQSLGFRATSDVSDRSLTLVAALDQDGLHQGIEEVFDAGADAVIAVIDENAAESIAQVHPAVGDLLWGLWLGDCGDEQLKNIVDLGADFLVFDPANVAASVLLQSEIGKILLIEPSYDNMFLGIAGHMPVDAVVVKVARGNDYVSVEDAVRCQLVASLTRKPLLADISLGIEDKGLMALWEVGVDGIVVRGEVGQVAESLKSIVEKVKQLPPRGNIFSRAVMLSMPGAGLEKDED